MTMSKRTKISRRENSNKAGYLFVLPYALLFAVFILTPVILAIILSFTNFNTIQFPKFVGFLNYINLITGDEVFMQYVLPNTVTYALIVGVGGYVLAFLLAANGRREEGLAALEAYLDREGTAWPAETKDKLRKKLTACGAE